MFNVEASAAVMDIRLIPSISLTHTHTHTCSRTEALLTLLEAQEGDPLDGRVSVFHVLVEVHQESLLLRPALLGRVLLFLLLLLIALLLLPLFLPPPLLLLGGGLPADAAGLVFARRRDLPVGQRFTFDLQRRSVALASLPKRKTSL